MASTSHNPTPTSSALTRNGIRTFRDDPELRSGEVISDALIQAIKESKIYIVVFSENYASSIWCLDELVEIQSMGRLVIPVFYYIEPMLVQHQIGSFHEAFCQHEIRYNANSSQVDVINEIVNKALQEVNPVTLDVAKYEVGLDSRVKDIATLFSNVTEGVIKIGLYGMGGVGKTTLAKTVFNQNYHHFNGSCFLENVREGSQTREGIAGLQKKLVNDVLKCTNITIDNADHGIELIRARICSTKILVIIDDLDSRDQFDFLVGPFALGSTIIITTRDEGLLNSIDVETKYKVNELGDVESRQLFCEHAFGGDNIMPDAFSELSKEIIERAAGLPLALKVCGSALFKKSEEGWRDFIDELRRVSIVNVEKILLISFNALDTPKLKDMFVDIACLFLGYEQDKAVNIMETCYTSVNYNIDILKERCLLSVDGGKRFVMHDLIVNMGRKIACNNPLVP
ncbi:TMV resistance protein N-like [Apium graveolens]|uniref:TMV resistance protein N-like n=1 Tax=Apium graveolens TaxID=4045 RepID=UPI003D79AD48